MKGSKLAETSPSQYLSYLSLGVFLLVMGGVGYLAFLAFVKGILAPEAFSAYGLVLVAVAAATASFFSPCSFSVLPAYLAFAGATDERQPPAARLKAAVVKGGVAALGVVTVVIVLGAVIGALGTGFGPSLAVTGPDPNPVTRGLRIGIGVFVGAMGLLHLLNLSHRIPLLGHISAWAIRVEGGPEPSLRSNYLYGAGYVAVGIGWVGPFLAAVAAFAASSGGFFPTLLAFVLFATTMGVLMLLISLLVGASQSMLLRRLRASTRAIQRVASLLLILVATGLIYSSINTGAFGSLLFPS